MNILQNLAEIQQQIAGKDPRAVVEGLVSSGRMTQEQLNQLKAQAEGIMPLLRTFMR